MEIIKIPLGFGGTDFIYILYILSFHIFYEIFDFISILAYSIFSLDVTNWDISAVCRENPPGNYAHRNLCKYIKCSGFESTKIKLCPKDSIFNPEFQVCVSVPKGSYHCECKYT